MDPVIRYLAQHGTAVVCVASDAPRSERLAAITVDARVSGGIAAELIAIALPQGGPVAVVTGSIDTQDHAEKLRGFAAILATLAPHLPLLPAVESHENPKETYRLTQKLFARRPNPSEIYINTANSMPVLRALEEMKILSQVQVVTTGLFKELVPYIESGKVLASLYQRPFARGKTAFEELVRFLVGGVRPVAVTLLAPDIVMRSDLSIFIDHI
jgi:LacI family transcriptional regulator